MASVSRSFGTERHFRAVPRIYPALRAPVPASATKSPGTAVPSVSHFAGRPVPLSSAGGTVCIVAQLHVDRAPLRVGRPVRGGGGGGLDSMGGSWTDKVPQITPLGLPGPGASPAVAGAAAGMLGPGMRAPPSLPLGPPMGAMRGSMQLQQQQPTSELSLRTAGAVTRRRTTHTCLLQLYIRECWRSVRASHLSATSF